MSNFNSNQFEETFTELVHNIPKPLKNWIKSRSSSVNNLFHKSTLTLEAVVDTNIIFQEVRAKMLHGSCFIEKLLDNPSLALYAPKQLEVEIFDKIELKFPKQKKTRGINLEDAKNFARELLTKIIIDDQYSNKALEKASETLGERDPKDITFLALTISEPKHGIITADKDLKDINEIESWSLGKVGEILTTLNKGELSFVIIHDVLPTIFELARSLTALLWKQTIDSIKALATSSICLVKAGKEIITEIPPILQMLIGAGALYAEYKYSSISSFLSKIMKVMKKIVNFFKPIFDFLVNIFKSLTLTSAMFVSYGNQALEEARTLDSKKCNHKKCINLTNTR